MGAPAQAQEAEALEKFRDLVPDDGIARAWANVTFTDLDGRLNEVDVLLLTKGGLWIVELKGWHGDISGNQKTWFHNDRVVENPRLLANFKAKRLASVLKDVARAAKLPNNTVPFVAEAVVLHGRDSRVKLDSFGAEQVWALDGFKVKGLGAGRSVSDLINQTAKHDPMDLPRANIVDKLMAEAGLMPRAKQRVIGQYVLDSGEPLGEGPGWQDFLVTHPRAKTKHRIRVFPYPKGADRETRANVDSRAEREFRLTLGLEHPGIIGPSEFLTPEEGPALVFTHDPAELSLGRFLEANADTLLFEDRERIVQNLAELIRFAHGQRLVHRALSPTSVRIKSDGKGSITVRIRDWDAARRADSSTSTMTQISRGVTDVTGAVDADSLLYLAPETLRGGTPASAIALDVYGVGALSYLVLTGKAPAANIAALEALVGSSATGLDPRAVMPEISDQYAAAIKEATAFNEMERTIDVSVFLEGVEDARRDIGDSGPSTALGDPLDAAVGEIVGERFEIVKRRGSGSTGVALEVIDYDGEDERAILKLAKDDAAAARLSAEANVLDRLDHVRIVRRLDGPLVVGTRQGILLSDAGTETLADRIRLEGKATIEQLERYSGDLFDAVAHLESKGVFHRDIKPSNLAVKPDSRTRKPHVTLFDFSLSDEPLANIRSGSKPYLDPYLGGSKRIQFDSAAERFALSVTLFELATSETIWWEQGDTPASQDDAPIVQAAMFDPSVADGLVEFFRTALSPDAAQRHATLEAMRTAWGAALSGAALDEADAEANDEKAMAAELGTLLVDSGLSARALSALSRVKVATVEELLGVSPMSINQIRGLGEQVRREISGRVRDWRRRLTATETQPEVPTTLGRRPLESIAKSLAGGSDESAEDRFKRWRKNATLKGATEDAARWLAELGGVATLDEVAAKLLREYGSTLEEEERVEVATTVVRAILELDSRARDPKFLYQTSRDRTRTAIAYAPNDEQGFSFDAAELHLETALRWGAAVDELLAESEVVPAALLRESLRGLEPEGVRFDDARLVQLAVGLSSRGRLSSMGEAYPAELDPARAVEIALRGAATRELAIVTIEQRVRARFPAIESIPSRPGLDAAVHHAMPYLEWQDEVGKYAVRAPETGSLTITGASTTWGRPASDPSVAARLNASIKESSALVLVVSRRHGLVATASQLAREYGLQVVDLADVALDALRTTAKDKGVEWSVVLAADGAPAKSQDRRNLHQLARIAITPRFQELLNSPEPTLFLHSAVLARLGLVDLIAGVTDLGASRAAARWFMLIRPQSGGTPDLDGVPMPFGADGWLEIAFNGVDVQDKGDTA
jgi:serine/threonine protein kinase